MLTVLWVLFVVQLVSSRPQNLEDKSNTKLDKTDDILHMSPFPISSMANKTKKEEEDTKLILEKIEALNKKQGLVKKKIPNYFHFPFSYSRKQEEPRKQTSFPDSIFKNPILEYLKSENELPKENVEMYGNKEGITIINTNTNAAATDDDNIPGQFIKRKITHQQTLLLPSMRLPTQPEYYDPRPQSVINQYINRNPNKDKTKSNLENQTINNIKNIIYNSQIPYPMPYINPYGFPLKMDQAKVPQYYPPYPQENYGRQFTSPLGQYFPIYIKDPFVQMFNAITSMVEYGPTAGVAKPGCKLSETNKKSLLENTTTENKTEVEISTPVPDKDNLPTVIRIARGKPNEKNKTTSKPTEFPKTIFKTDMQSNLYSLVDVPRRGVSPPNREKNPFVDEQEEKQVSNQGNNKLLSRDNTGSGIFIQRLKVRKGGVAIAGPGGIATAGSGGTAIVGPNGYAYTQPDSLAIAGSGTKVIAVEPTINLAELIQSNNSTKIGSRPRVGKVVAVGPVIYYNRG